MRTGGTAHLLFLADATSVHTQRWVGAMAARGWRCTVLYARYGGNAAAESAYSDLVEKAFVQGDRRRCR